MKKRWLLAVIAVLAIGMLIAACGEDSAVETTAATQPSATAATTQPAEVITLKYADQNSDVGWEGSHAAVPWLAQIEEACGGKVKIEGFYSQTLFNGTDAWESLKAGIADFGWCAHIYWAGMTPLADVVTLPFMPIKSAELGSKILWTLYEEFPSIKEEFAANHPVLAWTSSPYFLLTVDKAVKTLDDIKGMKIRTVGGEPTRMVKAMGGIPVSMGMPDTYQALQTGVIDGILQNWEALYSFRHYEVAKYLTLVPFHLVHFTQSFNLATWNGLPADVKAGIESVSGMEGSRFWGKNMFDSAEIAVQGILEKEGYELTYVEPAAEEVAMWREQFGEPLWEKWVADMESQGHPEARDILNRTLELIEQGL